MAYEGFTNGKWHFIGWYTPWGNEVVTVKTVKDNEYLMIEKANGDKYRYTLTIAVKTILNL